MYSEAFRLLILDVFDHSLEITNSVAASLDHIYEKYDVSQSTVRRWLDKYLDTGSVKPESSHHSHHTVISLEHINFVKELLAENSTYSNEELCEKVFNVYGVAYLEHQMKHAMNTEGYTVKVCQRISHNRNEGLRRYYKNNLARSLDEIPARCYAVVDESHLQPAEVLRRYGRSPHGYPAFVSGDVIGHFNPQVSCCAIAAMSIEGVFAVTVHEENVDHNTFLDALEHDIFPHMNPFPGDRSVLLMDNASTHVKIDIYNMCAEFGVMVVFLPPYSYDFSPIEPVFHLAKAHIRKKWGIMYAYKPLAAQLHEALWSCCTAETACNLFNRVDITVTWKEQCEACNY